MADAATAAVATDAAALEAEYQQGITLIATDPEEAVELLGKVLEQRNKEHGDMSDACAETYLWYARALLEQARCSTDALGSRGKPAAAAAAAGPSAAAKAPETLEPSTTTEPSATKAASKADDKADAKAEDKAEPAAEESGGEEDEGEQDGDDQEEEEEEGDGEQGAADSDDLRLAWEMLELARMICVKSEDPKLASTLASVHLTLGDVSAEKDEFETALAEYGHCQRLLEGMAQQDKRALAGVHFSTMLVLTLVDDLPQARSHCKKAIAILEARRAEIMVVMDTPVEGETGEDVDQEIDALEKQLDEIDALLKDLKERLEDVESAIKEQASFKGVLKAAMQTMAGVQGASTEPGAPSTSTAQPAATTSAANAPLGPLGSIAAAATAVMAGGGAPAAPALVQNLGVAGRGRTRITLQPCQPTAVAAAAKGTVLGKRGIGEISGSGPGEAGSAVLGGVCTGKAAVVASEGADIARENIPIGDQNGMEVTNQGQE